MSCARNLPSIAARTATGNAGSSHLVRGRYAKYGEPRTKDRYHPLDQCESSHGQLWIILDNEA
jgi:hypothetical protein